MKPRTAGTNGRRDAFSFLHDLVAIASPTGSEGPVVDFLVDAAKQDGFRASRDKIGNFVAEAGKGKRRLLFVGHVDTVPGEIPVRIEGDALYGRGAVDAKGPLTAFYWAARDHLDDADLRIQIVGAIDEEGDSRGARALEGMSAPDWIIIGEPSGSDGITLGYKGIVRGQLEVERPHHHGAHPDPSAADELVAAWSNLATRFGFEEKFDAVQGRLLEVSSRNDGLTDRASARFALRLPPSVTTADASRSLAEVARSRKVHLRLGEKMEAAVADKRSSLVAAYLASIRASGREPHLKRKTGTADFNYFHAWHPSVPIIAYGPGDSSLDHTPNEHVTRAEFEAGVETNRRALTRLAESQPLSRAAARLARS